MYVETIIGDLVVGKICMLHWNSFHCAVLSNLVLATPYIDDKFRWISSVQMMFVVVVLRTCDELMSYKTPMQCHASILLLMPRNVARSSA